MCLQLSLLGIVTLFSTTTSLFGISTIPVPLALSSESLFVSVVAILFPVITISSNCAVPLTVRLSATSTKSDVSVSTLPGASVKLPPTVGSFSITTLLSGIITSPVPLARNSKSLLLLVVVITLSLISISSKFIWSLIVTFSLIIKSSTVTSWAVVFLSVVAPSTVKFFSNTTSFSATSI